MEYRNLDGCFFRLNRTGEKWENVCLSDMTDEERNEKLKGNDENYYMQVIHHLCKTIRNIGDQFDIAGS